MIYPSNFEKKIEFDEIRTQLKGRCLSDLGAERVDDMVLLTTRAKIEEELCRVSEFGRLMDVEDWFPDDYFYDLRPALMQIRVENTYLEELDLFNLKRSLETISSIVTLLNKGETSGEGDDITYVYPYLQRMTAGVQAFPAICQHIGNIVNKFGKVKDNASASLMNIRNAITETTKSVSFGLRNILKRAQQEGYIEKDASPTVRDGRLVIPIVPAMKRKIKGIVHDESASGKTIFIEPAEVVDANNRIRELKGEEKREVIRILKEVAALIRPHVDEIIPSYRFLGEVDFIRAKTLWAAEAEAIAPRLEDRPMLDYIDARHPLLQQSLTRNHKTVVPLNIRLDETQRILLISGPNAGGKSVCLKTVGLLQYMVQSGIPIPVRENSRVGVFKHIFIDIGDEQSIEDDLSTYSSHLLNMKMMMKYCDGSSLLLIDEFGGGTEPQIGGAIAEAILHRFVDSKTYGVITTHYQNLKHFADEHEGIVNGAMLYDRHNMQALFQLEIGRPGSSFAVEIARKIGITEEVIADASELVGTAYIQTDKYLQDIVRDKRYWENKRQNVHQKEKQLDEIIARYEKEMSEFERTRKEVLAQAKEEAARLLRESNAKVEKTIKEIRESQAEKEKTLHARKELNEFLEKVDKQPSDDEKIARKIEQLTQRRQRREERKAKRKQQQNGPTSTPESKPVEEPQKRVPAVGDYVRINGQTSVGRVLEINGRNAVVLFGMMRTITRTNQLECCAAPQKSEEDNRVYTHLSKETRDSIYEKKLEFKPDIDVRGMRGEEALKAVSYFIDDAILVGAARVRILHGTGTGALRTLIREYLSGVPEVSHYQDEHITFGGSGITVVDF